MTEQILMQILEEIKEIKSEQKGFSLNQIDFSVKLEKLTANQTDFSSNQTDFSVKLEKLTANQTDFSVKLEKLTANQTDFATGQRELNLIVSAIRTNLETTNAKLDALTMDVRRLEGHTNRIENKLDEQSATLRGDLRFLNHRVADLEMDVHKTKAI